MGLYHSMKPIDPNSPPHSSSNEPLAPDRFSALLNIDSLDSLDSLLAQSPLQEPPPWFMAQTVSRLRREQHSLERRSLRWIWSAVTFAVCLLIYTGFEIQEQSDREIMTLTSLDTFNNPDDHEEIWFEQ